MFRAGLGGRSGCLFFLPLPCWVKNTEPGTKTGIAAFIGAVRQAGDFGAAAQAPDRFIELDAKHRAFLLPPTVILADTIDTKMHRTVIRKRHLAGKAEPQLFEGPLTRDEPGKLIFLEPHAFLRTGRKRKQSHGNEKTPIYRRAHLSPVCGVRP